MPGSRRERRRRLDRVVLALYGGLLVYAPLAFGTTTELTRYFFDGWIVVATLLLVFNRVRHRNLEETNPLFLSRGLVAALVILSLVGATFLWNPKFAIDRELWDFKPLEEAISWLPGTYDFETSLPEVIHTFCLSLFLGGVSLLFANRDYRWALLAVIAVMGFVIAVIGIYQKASGLSSMLWTTKEYESLTFFAAFRYHGNAASFLNLCWPASLALLLRTLNREEPGPLIKAWWINCFIFTVGALLVNTSKFGHLSFLPALGIALWLFRRRLPAIRGSARVNGVLIGFLVVAALAILSLFSAEIISSKWEEALERGVSFQKRLMAYESAWKMAGSSGILGFGPGTFGILFPFYTISFGDELGGKWTFAHQDYLQVFIEWGLIGFAAIAYVVGGGVIRLWKRYRRSRLQSLSYAAGLLSMVLVLGHALVDFPLHIAAIQAYVVIYLALGWAPSLDSSGSGKRQPSSPSIHDRLRLGKGKSQAKRT